jgi:hypothetical protein
MAMVLLGAAAAGVLLPFAYGVTAQADGFHRTLGAILANDLIEQTAATPFDQIVSNYNYSESQGQLKDASGNTLTDSMYANFSREIGCVWDSDQDFFIVATVRVYYQGQEVAAINRLMSE